MSCANATSWALWADWFPAAEAETEAEDVPVIELMSWLGLPAELSLPQAVSTSAAVAATATAEAAEAARRARIRRVGVVTVLQLLAGSALSGRRRDLWAYRHTASPLPGRSRGN